MFSALKRLTSKSEVNGTPTATPPGHVRAMSTSLQKKFSKGVQYNMKIILRGDRNTGKSALYYRLQGLPFVEEYTQTEEIQVANIQWNYKTTDDIVKVEVWDVVDKAKKKKSLPNKLKIENNHIKNGQDDDVQEAGVTAEYCLDASFLDVYKNTNGVIFIFDITKQWTFDYVKREVSTVPLHIPILILGSHRDMGHHRAIAADTVHYFIEGLNREESSAEIRYAESSMRNGFGLKFIHRFFNLPFLQLQRETLLKQVQTNREEHDVTVQELDFYADSDDSNYDLFIEGLSQKRRQVADALGPQKISVSIEKATALAHEKAMKEGNVAAAVALASKPSIIIESSSSNSKPTVPSTSNHIRSTELGSNSTLTSANNKPVSKDNQPTNQGIVPAASTLLTNIQLKGGNGKSSNAGVDVDDFMPEDNHGIDKSFFDQDATPSRNNKFNGQNSKSKDLHYGSSEEDEREALDTIANPLVASFVEDVVPEVYSSPISNVGKKLDGSESPPSSTVNKSPGAPTITATTTSASKFCILSSSEEELSIEKDESNLNSEFKLNLNLSQPIPLDLDLGIFLKDQHDSRVSPSAELSSKHHRQSGDSAKDKKSKKSSSTSTSSKHHKKSKHKKSSSSSKKDKQQRDLDDFLNGSSLADSSHQPDDGLDAYEAL